MENYDSEIRKDLHRFLHGMGRVDEKLPESADFDEMWPQLKEAYLPDGVREFEKYPVVSLGWIMFVGMAFAWYWDNDFQKLHDEGAAKMYAMLRDKEGYDNMDDYILKDVLKLDEKESEETSKVVAECAARIYHHLQKAAEPGTEQAIRAYLDSLHQLYNMGVAMELNALGYHMTKLGE